MGKQKELSLSDLEFKESYVYNEKTKQYVFLLKKLGRNIILESSLVKEIISCYTGLYEAEFSTEKISLRFNLPKQIVEEVLKALGVTHDSLPILPEELVENSDDKIVEKLLQERKFSIYEKFQKRAWLETQKDAQKWSDYKNGIYNPFKDFLRSWKPPKRNIETISKENKNKSNYVFVVGISDLHFGSAANGKYMFNKSSWSTDDTIKSLEKYSKSIIEDAKNKTYKFDKCLIVSLGDIIHSMMGKTARGTELNYDLVREEQFDAAMSSLTVFIENCVNFFGKCEVHATHGNHFYELDMALFRALGAYFRQDKRIKFHHYSSRPSAFREGNTLFLIDHGADSGERSYVPGGQKRQSFIQSHLLSNPKLLEGVKTRLFLQGDKHHWENIEYNDFEFVMLGTTLGSDQHAATNNWKNRPRQTCLILNNDGLKEVSHIYFD